MGVALWFSGVDELAWYFCLPYDSAFVNNLNKWLSLRGGGGVWDMLPWEGDPSRDTRVYLCVGSMVMLTWELVQGGSVLCTLDT